MYSRVPSSEFSWMRYHCGPFPWPCIYTLGNYYSASSFLTFQNSKSKCLYIWKKENCPESSKSKWGSPEIWSMWFWTENKKVVEKPFGLHHVVSRTLCLTDDFQMTQIPSKEESQPWFCEMPQQAYLFSQWMLHSLKYLIHLPICLELSLVQESLVGGQVAKMLLVLHWYAQWKPLFVASSWIQRARQKGLSASKRVK